MVIELKFDYYSRFVYIPDGYVYDLKNLELSFLDWMQDKPECIVHDSDNVLKFSFDENDFVEYVNMVVLNSCMEKAYFVDLNKKFPRKKNIIKF